MKIVFSFLSFFIIISGASAQHYVYSSKKYVDMHMHVACFGIKSDCFIGAKMKKAWFRYKGLEYLFGISEGEVRRQGGDDAIFPHLSSMLAKSTRVESGILLSFDQVYEPNGTPRKDLSLFYVPNDFVYKGTQKYSNLHFAASVHPYRKDALKELERVDQMGAMFIKLIPSIHQFHPNDKNIEPYWKKLAQLNLPVLIHLDDEGTFGTQAEIYTGAYKIERALELGVTVIAAHVASSGHSHVSHSFHQRYSPNGPPMLDHYEQLRLLAKKYPNNLYVDLSALPLAPTRRYVLDKILTDPVWKGKMLYGSDFPLNHWALQSIYSFQKAWPTWRKNGVSPREFWRVGGSSMEQRWDRDLRLKEGFGVKEEVFLKSREFFEDLGRL